MATKTKSILLLGATGPAGIVTLKHALERGHNVTVYARSPKKIPEELTNHPNCTVIAGTLTSPQALYTLLPNIQTIISVLGPVGLRHKGHDVSNFYSSLLSHIRSSPSPAPHILALTTASFTRPDDAFSLIAFILVTLVWLAANGAYKEVIRIGEVFEKEGEGVPWTVFRVSYLGEGEGAGEANAGAIGKGGWNSRMERRELAQWLVGEAERGVEGSEWIGKFPALFGGRKKDA